MKPLTIPMKAAPLLGPKDKHDNDTIFNAIKQLKKWPKIATLKVDGIRAVRTTDLMSCRNKMIPNVSIRQRSMSLPYGFDCELYSPSLQYDEIESIVMSREHERSGEIGFYFIDQYADDLYSNRINYPHPSLEFLIVKPIFNWAWSPEELMKLFLAAENDMGEGICFRTPDSPYKQGRSTLKEEYLIKLCRYERTEVEIVGTYEQMLNQNSARSSVQGYTERSKSIGAMIGKDTLGGFYVKDSKGLEFKVGTGVGLTDKRRQELWNVRDQLVGKTITIKSKSHGMKIKPRSPIFCGFRETSII